ncbi:ribosome biogenesis GTPase Der [Coxiella endosymbiont of Ornithodoros maritimus]|uniref:ribosome biogenesis GTPase Der n=1 Tax=Coxiella endosymbiont of Ornithodoros maritimus TaxID=1656172 RepID=UPI002264B7A6|nr:ribosome biogenesis GTPase Der [Coxiella endosymbiont of Ornithodoros maritimus]
MLPVIAIVGRPNVGKSTLFNYLTKSRAALVTDVLGVTRDRQYGETTIDSQRLLVVDTGGLVDTENKEVAPLAETQAEQAIDESDYILFLVDAKAGLVPADEIIAERLRKKGKKIFLAVNKADRARAAIVQSDFYKLGFGEPHVIAATNGRGVKYLMTQVLKNLPEKKEVIEKEVGIKTAMIGRPNVGKSTLINRLLGEERVIVYDQPGTTRDSIYIPFARGNENYTLIDTAGIRRRSKIQDYVEKFSMIKSLEAMHTADVVIFVLDARQGVTEQDLRLLNRIVEAGVSLIIAVNKWDGLKIEERDNVRNAIDRRMPFVDFARRYFISALYGTGVGKLFRAIRESYQSIQQELTTAQLTMVLEKAVAEHEPPLVKGRRIRLRYAHLGGRHPLTIVVHGKQTKSLPQSYSRYLSNYFRKTLNFIGVPIHVKLKTDLNPYEDQEER